MYQGSVNKLARQIHILEELSYLLVVYDNNGEQIAPYVKFRDKQEATRFLESLDANDAQQILETQAAIAMALRKPHK